MDDDIIPVTLKKGINTLLLKVEERGNRWEFCVRLLPFSTQKLMENGGIFKIATKENGEAELASELSTTVLNELVQTIHYTIRDNQQKIVLTEQRSHDFAHPLALKISHLQPFTAELNIQLKNGEKLTQLIPFEAGKRINYTLFAKQKSSYRIALAATASFATGSLPGSALVRIPTASRTRPKPSHSCLCESPAPCPSEAVS